MELGLKGRGHRSLGQSEGERSEPQRRLKKVAPSFFVVKTPRHEHRW